jgi:hypothetical protein
MHFISDLDADEVYLIQRIDLCLSEYLRKWLFRVMRPNMPLHIVLARHALRARDYRASVLLLRVSADSFLVSLGFNMSFKVLSKVFAVFDCSLAVWTCVSPMRFEVLAVLC